MRLTHYIIETTSRFHVYAPSEEAVDLALDKALFDPDDTDDRAQTVVTLSAVLPDELAEAGDHGIPVLDAQGDQVVD